ncbi:MAG: PilT/PilU family type 4a pilus ATPase [Pseudomonadota bacterium]
MDFNGLLKLMVEKNASDLFISVGVPPSLKVHGKVMPVGSAPLGAEHTAKLAHDIMDVKQRSVFQATQECNFAINPQGIGRFRVNVFVQQQRVGMVLRKIETRIPKFEELRLPPILQDIAMTKRGLVIFVGATGSGKSTSLAAMIGYRNENSSGHIITIEDPIEFVHEHKGCIVTQREVGVDTESFDVALKNTLRQAPDVILIGEIRARETMEHAIAFAETGHLCLSTLHANSANQAMDRIINFFPEDRRQQLLMDLSLNLKAVIAQRLIPTVDGKGRRAAVEILLNTPLVSDLLLKGEVHALKDLMTKSGEQGMKTFDQALFDLYSAGEISYDDAIRHADSANELRLMIKLSDKGSAGKLGSALEGVTLVDTKNQ